MELGNIAVWYEYSSIIYQVLYYIALIVKYSMMDAATMKNGAAVSRRPGVSAVLLYVYAVGISEYAFRRVCRCFSGVALHCFAPKPTKTGNPVYHDFAMPLRWSCNICCVLVPVSDQSQLTRFFFARHGLAAQLHSAAALQCWRGLPRVRWALRILPTLHFWFYWWSYSSQQQTVRCRDQLGRRSAPRQEGQW